MPEGDVFAISLPRRGSKSPPAYASRMAMRERLTTASCIEHSTFCPCPVVCRCHSAAITPIAACMPVPESPMVGPGLSGGEPGKPVSAIAPPVACAIMSKLLYSL